jgi:methyltransferase (TIGR00027 family)
LARSLVAGVNALFRAEETRRLDRILTDPYAARLAETGVRVGALRYARFAVPALRRLIEQLQVAHCVRHAALDVLVLQALSQGCTQVVTIGAGCDMRPSRLPSSPDVRWIEVDHPDSAAYKWRLLQGVSGLRLPMRVAVDLEREAVDLGGLDRARPTVFVLEGLVHYLRAERFEALLRAMEPFAQRQLLLSYIDPGQYFHAPPLFIRTVQWLREVPARHFTAGQLAEVLERHGLGQLQTWDVAAQVTEFAPQAVHRPVGVSQHVARAVAHWH